MKIGIIGAMEEEVKKFRDNLCEPLSWEQADALFISGSLGKHEVIIVRSGIGKVLASITTSLLIQQYGVNMVINVGSAGGIGTSLRVGDIVISDKVAYFDVDTTGFGYKPGQLPDMPLYYKANTYLKTEMLKTATAMQINAKEGLIVTGDTFVDSPQKIKEILTNFPEALACEMEGAAVGQTARQFNIPFLVVRAMSDTADHSATQSFDDFIEDTGKFSAEIVIECVRRLV